MVFVLGMRLTFGTGAPLSEFLSVAKFASLSACVIGYSNIRELLGRMPGIVRLALIALVAADLFLFGGVALILLLWIIQSVWIAAQVTLRQRLGLIGAALATLWFTTIAHATTIWSPLLPELIMSVNAPLDMMFHTALAKLMGGFGVVSLGIDGLVPINYHPANHAFVWGLSWALGMDPAWIFGVYYPLFATPVLTFAALSLIARLRSDDGSFWALLGWIFVLMTAGYWQAFGSETYAASLIIICGMLHIIVRIGKTERLSVLPLLSLAALVLVTSFVKLPSGFGAGVLVGSYFVSRGKWGLKGWTLGLLTGALPFALSLLFYLRGEGTLSVPIEPFGFFVRYPKSAFPPLIVGGIALWLTFRRNALTKTPLVQASLWAICAVVLVSSAFNAGAGSIGYFSNQTVWFFIPVMAVMARAISTKGWVAPILIGLSFLLTFEQLERRIQRAYVPQILAHRDWASQTPLGQLQAQVSTLKNRPDGVFIDPSYADFWAAARQCNSAPLAAVATLGMPMLQGHPPLEFCPRGEGHGYHLFPVDTALANDVPTDPMVRMVDLCDRAGSRAMRQLLDVLADDTALIDCARQSRQSLR